jgi:hypothetical protein
MLIVREKKKKEFSYWSIKRQNFEMLINVCCGLTFQNLGAEGFINFTMNGINWNLIFIPNTRIMQSKRCQYKVDEV